MGLYDADRRYEIGTDRMSAITNRVHEIEEERNTAMRRNLIISEMEKSTNPDIKKHLRKELSKLNTIDTASDRDTVYREIVQGYKPMSRRKNELQSERNHYVKEIEDLDK